MFNKSSYLSNIELSAFCKQISLVIKAGLPTYYGVSILCDEAPDTQTKQLLTQIYEPMALGSTLFSAINDTDCFPPYMINMVKLGEETGRLEEVMDALSVYYDREEEIQSGIKSAVVYPLVLSIVMIAVIIVMVSKVLPVFSQIYAELGSDLSGSAAFLMNVSNIINSYIVVILVVVVVVAAVLLIFFNTRAGKRVLQHSSLSVSIAQSRFANCMYLALSSGLDTDQGLSLSKELIENNVVVSRIDDCKQKLSSGETFSDALLSSNIFSKMYSSWIAIGSRTGSMDEVMSHICTSCEDETDKKLSRFISVLEPALVVVLCFFIGFILVSFLLPLLGIMSSIG